jgi:hypothetical protein
MRPGDVEAVRAPVRRPLKPTVLVVEHEAIVRMDLATELQDHGFDVLEAASADAALALSGHVRTCTPRWWVSASGGRRPGTSWVAPCARIGRAAP